MGSRTLPRRDTAAEPLAPSRHLCSLLSGEDYGRPLCRFSDSEVTFRRRSSTIYLTNLQKQHRHERRWKQNPRILFIGNVVKEPLLDALLALAEPSSTEGPRGVAAEPVGASPTVVTTAILALTRDATARDLLMEIAIERGYGLCCAVDGGEAIAVLTTEPPALVVVDIDTPDGRALLRALRAEERWRGIPIFALTATNNPMVTVTIDAPVFFKPDLGGLEDAVVGRFESTEHLLPPRLPNWLHRPPSA